MAKNTVYSNVEGARLDYIIQSLCGFDRNFLERNLLLIDKTTHAINQATGRLAEIAGFSLEDARKYRLPTTQYSHHALPEQTTMVALLPSAGEARAVIARAKCADSIIEKLAKLHGQGKMIVDDRLAIQDVNGFKVITQTEKDAYELMQRIKEGFQCLDEDDYFGKPKESGYKALHAVLKDPQGNLFELQAKTIKQAAHDMGSHSAYAARRLRENGHGDLSEFAIVVVDNRALYKGEWLAATPKHSLGLVKGNQFAQYWLLQEKGSQAPQEIAMLNSPMQLFAELR